MRTVSPWPLSTRKPGSSCPCSLHTQPKLDTALGEEYGPSGGFLPIGFSLRLSSRLRFQFSSFQPAFKLQLLPLLWSHTQLPPRLHHTCHLRGESRTDSISQMSTRGPQSLEQLQEPRHGAGLVGELCWFSPQTCMASALPVRKLLVATANCRNICPLLPPTPVKIGSPGIAVSSQR